MIRASPAPATANGWPAAGGIAGILLQIAALLDPNGIPTDLFHTRAVTNYCGDCLWRPVGVDDTRDAIRALLRLGLVSILSDVATPSGALLRVHALVQRVTRDATPDEQRRRLAVTAGDALVEVWPQLERDATHAQHLRANTIQLHAVTGALLWDRHDGAHEVLQHGCQAVARELPPGARAVPSPSRSRPPCRSRTRSGRRDGE